MCRIKRSGIALIITIAFIAAVAALIGLSFGRLDDAYQRVSNKRFLVQSDILLSRMFEILKRASSDVNDSTGLDIFLSVPFAFENKEFDMLTTVAFESAASRPNINWLVENSAADPNDPYAPVPLNPDMEDYLDRILSLYNITDRVLFVSMVADTIDEDLQARSPGSEIAMEDVDFTQGRLYGLHHFMQVVAAYERATLDPAIRTVPWASLIGFSNGDIDFNHISPEVLSVLMPELGGDQSALFTTDRLDVYSSLEELPLSPEAKERMEALHVVFYDPGVKGDILIRNGEQRLHATFLYNLGTKEVSDLELSQ